MDPRTLPPDIIPLYERLRHTYAVGFEPVRLGDLRLHLLRITDIEPLLGGKNPLEDVSAFPFWVKLWESSLVLAQMLATQPAGEGRSLLELGAGLGLPGLAAAARGWQVTLSDFEDLILDFQQVNVAANRLAGVECRMLDWLAPGDLPRYDCVIGAEILFRDTFFEPLLAVFRQALKPGGVIYLAHEQDRQSLAPFLALAEKEYVIGCQRRTLKAIGGDKTILLNRLVPRA
ncbi:MAG: methyltransferase [Desulfobulbaceae bacterium A2]|nr:MAG: methyltransferase [Desulfobulbaceae bacterium A2]